MKRLLLIVLSIATLSVSCDSRFNWHDLLKVEPAPADAVATYKLNSGSAAHGHLLKMGYTSIDSTVRLEPDFTFSGTGVPGCCLHGWDESATAYPFTGGLYDIKGTWKVEKSSEIYILEFSFSEIVETTGRKIADPKLAKDREPPKTVRVYLVRGTPFTIGFPVFNGDFYPVAYDRTSSATK